VPATAEVPQAGAVGTPQLRLDADYTRLPVENKNIN